MRLNLSRFSQSSKSYFHRCFKPASRRKARGRKEFIASGRGRPAARAFFIVLFALLGLAWLIAPLPAALTANPASGTLTDASGPVTYTAGPFAVPNVTAQVNGQPICGTGTPCDDFSLTVAVSATTTATMNVKIQIQWPVSAADFDLYVLNSSNAVIASSASSADPEIALIPAVTGTYKVRVAPFNPAGQSFTGTISLVPKPPAPPGATGIAPRYKDYAAPPGGGDSAGEPSIGVDWIPKVASLKHDQVNTGGVAFFTANSNELRVSFDDCSSPAKGLWEDVTSPQTSAGGLDPIGFVDRLTGRVFQSQLAAAAGSILVFSDDDGQNWTQSQGAGQPAGVDHQTVGGGPYNPNSTPPPPLHPLYMNAVYYASQDAATAFIARSDDGGLTFGAGVPMWNLTQCGGLHGHIKVAPDGTVYVPNKSCSVGQGSTGIAVSTDNGLTWTLRTVPGSTSGDTDPSLGIATDGTIYLGYQNGDGHPHLAVSHNRGMSWVDNDIGALGGIKNSVFPEVVAGDPNRAAFGFLGTTTGGNYQDTANFKGVWYFFIATTYDGGNSFFLIDATGGDPVQVGSICTGGTTCGSDRNLLDFNDISVDKEGRVLAAFADGCVAPGCNANSPPSASRSAKATIIRQSGGRRLFAAFDPPEPAVPAAPRLNAALRDATGVTVTWDEPDNSGSPLTGYKVYRGTSSGGETFLANIGPTTTKYLDAAADPATPYFYRVTAVNAQGEGPFCGEVQATAAPSPCLPPGLTILTDPSGDELDMLPSHDIQSISLSEPFFGPGVRKLVFTIKMADLSVVPTDTTWPVTFVGADNNNYFVKMKTDAAGNVSFAYGSGTNVTVAGTPADPASNFAPNGTITIVIPTSGIGNPQPGQSLTQFLMRVRVESGVGPALTPDNCPDNLGPTGSYTLVDACLCRPKTPPIASLKAMPTSGIVPLTVAFDGSASSDPDAGDTIASYTFDFGDGSAPVTQASPTISHTYAASGEYRATLKVTEAPCAQLSANTALAIIEVEDCKADPVITVPRSVPPGTTGIVASVPAHTGSTFNWTVGGGALTGGQGTHQITFNAGPAGTCMMVTVVETAAGNCVSAQAGAKVSVDFTDAPPSNSFHDQINVLRCNGITVGCAFGQFCPDNSTRRDEMAIFIIRALGDFTPPSPAEPTFADVPKTAGSYPFVEKFHSLGITSGCGFDPGSGKLLYCPERAVTRREMAIFLVRAVHTSAFVPPPATCMDGHTIDFTDVACPDSSANYIEQLFHDAITFGCGANLYCPEDPVQRGQMAAFLVRAFHLK